MNEFMIHNQIKALSDQLTEAENSMIKKQNECLQDFVIWLKGYLDGNISKRGDGKE